MSADFFDLAHAQRACRSFTPDPVPPDDIGRMIEAATRAPNAHNSQPWEFVVVRSAEVRTKLADLARGSWRGGREALQARLESVMFADVDRFVAEQDYGGAPVLIVLGVDLSKVSELVAGCSIYPAAQNLMLAAQAMGYGSTFTNFGVGNAAAVGEIVGFPDQVRVAGVIAVGRPARPLGPGRRNPWTSSTHADRYGEPWAPAD